MGLNVKCETVDRIGNYENSAVELPLKVCMPSKGG